MRDDDLFGYPRQGEVMMIKFLIDPFNLLLFLIFITVAARFLQSKKIFKWLFVTSIVWFLIISTPLIPNTVLDSLESRYVPVDTEQFSEQQLEMEYHIVVLGGGHGFDDRLPASSLLSLNALARLTEGIRIHQQLPDSKLVLSGYSSSGRTTQAEMLRESAILLGVKPEDLLIQKEPGNTYEEGEIYSDVWAGNESVILVTSAAHMPRAISVFNHFGIDAIPSPANYRLKGSQREKIFGWPSINNISKLNTGIYEYAALLRDRLSGI